MRKIILASTSKHRKELLIKAGLVFEVVPCNYEEDMTLDMMPSELAKHLSYEKAKSVASNFKDAIIISADTFVSFQDKVIGKPHTVERAQQTLRTLSGQTHSVFTGFTIIDTKEDKVVSNVVETRVTFKEVSDETINNYIKTGNPLKYAGSYTLNDIMEDFIEKIEGDQLNIIGLPVESVVETLKEFDVNI